VQPGLRVDRRELPFVRLGPARPLVLTEVVEAGALARQREKFGGVECDEASRVADRVAEQVEPPHPLRVFHRLHAPTLSVG
jgi:hypothetical protein